MRRCALPAIRPVAAAILVTIAAAPGPVWSVQPPADQRAHPAGASGAPSVPPGALRIVNVAWHGGRSAICAEAPGSAVDATGRPLSRTRVWLRDGTTTRQVALGPGACDPAWAPDGDRLAVVTPDGLWVLSADLRRTTHLVDVRRTDVGRAGGPQSRFERRALSGPQWAPDASALAFVVSNSRTVWVEVVDTRTGARRYASDPETYEFAWEADSRSLRFGSRVVRLP